MSSEAYLQMANLYFQQGNYAEALEWYEAIDELNISSDEKARFNFQKGYCLFHTGKQAESKPYFESVQNNPLYADNAKYYLGYIAYDSDDYAKAESYFREVQDDATLSKNVSYFQANMYFKQALYDEAN